jgi:malto-oligosyltrehalose trehalohydrolase
MAQSTRFAPSWGAEYLGAGRARFRLWAPALGRLHLRIDGRDLPLRPDADGWCEWLLDDVAPGASYRYLLESGQTVPDPASRAQQDSLAGPSLLVDHDAYQWQHADWRGLPWEATVYYELHVGTFTPEGTFRAAMDKLGHLRNLGITTIELMPVGHFPGERGWGYDPVLIYAPHPAYGTPNDLKAFIDAAHGHGLNVVLDVIYNHFGPEGNYLSGFAPEFFHLERHTPWGGAIAYEKQPVRRYFIDNALYWLDVYRFDGLRFDAVDHIQDEESEIEIVVEIAETIRARFPDRQIHLTTEDNRNITRFVERGENGEVVLINGEWNDDFHNAAHSIASGETEGYYADFVQRHWWRLARSLAEGFAFQGEVSPHGGEPRGEPSAHLPPTAFVDFVQNHDQIGNRAFGERLIDLATHDMVETLMAMLLLSPHIPLMFMGEEWGETRPFAFFTNYEGELADAVREGRRNEFAGFQAFHGDPSSLRQVPDPNATETFESSKINWDCLTSSEGRSWMAFTKRLLRLRRERVVPLLAGTGRYSGKIEDADDGVVSVSWRLNGGMLHMVANLDDELRRARPIAGEIIHASSEAVARSLAEAEELAPSSIVVSIGSERQDIVTTK